MTAVWRLDTGAKVIRKDAVKMVEATVQLSDITKESEEMQIEVRKRLTRAKGNAWMKRISFPQ